MLKETPPPPPFDSRALRNVLGRFATGVTVVTTLGEGGAPVGLVVNSFSAVSLDPPLILWSIVSKAPSRVAFQSHPGFAVNIMGAEAAAETMQFARPSDDKFAGIDWQPGHHGVPVLGQAIATLECELADRLECGDHEIMIGSVLRIAEKDGAPLLFHRGQLAEIGEAI